MWENCNKTGKNRLIVGLKVDCWLEAKRRTTLRIPTWSPTVVLTEPDDA